jgi:hypothetical protein
MKRIFSIALVTVLLFSGLIAATTPAQAQKKAPDQKSAQAQKSVETSTEVCPNPSAPCQHKQKRFEPYELSFRLPSKLKKTIYKSSVFYGIILETIAESDCDEGETSSVMENKRKNAQAFLSDHKVFADHQCPNMTAVSYIFNGEPNTGSFLGVYAGETMEEAEEVLATAKERYPEASIKKMQVVFDYAVLFQ